MRRVASLRGRGRVSPALRQRLVLMVTSVNRCPYRASFHRYVSRLGGITGEEIALLLDGSTRCVPEEEAPALLYARLWAERLALMGSHFYAPEEIWAMLEAYGASARVEADGQFGRLGGGRNVMRAGVGEAAPGCWL